MKYPAYKFVLAALDFVVLRLSFFFAIQLRGISRFENSPLSFELQSPEFYFFFIYSVIVLFIFQSNNLYKIKVFLTRSKQLSVLLISFFYAIIGLAVIAFFVHSPHVLDSRLAVAYFALIGFTSVAAYRILIFRPVFVFLSRKKLLKKRLLIVGSNLEAITFAIKLKVDNIYGLQLVGFADDDLAVGSRVFESYQVIGKIRDVPNLVRDRKIGEIIITVSAISHRALLSIIEMCKKSGALVRVTSSLFDVIHRKVSPEKYFDIPVAYVKNPLDGRIFIWLKRVFDIAATCVGLVILALPMVVIALLIKKSSKGPVLYKQVRVGKDGKHFNFYKFRSMYDGSDVDDNHVQQIQKFIRAGDKNGNGSDDSSKNGNNSTKVVNERMITPIGRFIRKTSIDELPQLFNVLKGDMTLVGPRPCLPYEFKMYEDWHKRRLSVVPGCTGLWQVSHRSQGNFVDMVMLDLYYIDNISPWLDLQLILKTIPVMIFGRGGK